MREFITYGFYVNPLKFRVAHQHQESRFYLNKPEGGLWCSPVNTDFGWKDWCQSECFRLERLKIWTKFVIRDDIQILTIDSISDLVRAMEEFGEFYPQFGKKFLNWDKIKSAGYNGVYLTYRGNRECHLPMNPDLPDLYAWDCESMVLLDLDHVDIIGYGREE